MTGYIFGGDTGIDSAQELQRKRAMVEALQGQVASAAPRTFGQGINAVGKALAARVSDRAIGKKEDAERERMQGVYYNNPAVMEALGYGGGAPSPSMSTMSPQVSTTPLTPNPGNLPQNIIDAVDRVDPQDPAMAIRAGLVSRGLPEHVADGFVMNFRDESGLNPGVNEAQPMVPGSRGGFGLAQWTGPRRQALEAFAQQQGLPVDDEDLQLDFLMSELQGPESRAAQSIMATQDAGSAAAAIASDFLRPAPEHLNRRVAQYTGQQPQQSQGVNPQIIAQLSEMAANPYLPEGQRAVVNALLQQQMQSMDPMRAMEMERAQLELEQMRNPQPEGEPAEIRELRIRAQEAGLQPGTPEYQTFMMNGGRVENGMVIESDGQGGFRMVQGSGAGAAAARPFTEAQSKDVVFSTRARGALEAFEPVADALTSRQDRALDWLPMGVGREAQTDEFQVAENAGNEFLQAILRKDTGAAITRDEQVLYGETFLPQPGDGEAVLAAKRAARLRAIEAIEGGMSPAQIVAQERALGEIEAARNARPSPASGQDSEGWTVIDGVRVREKR